jgi:hypothetical protein
MELTKEQIQHIDDSFVKNGIKYWDLRIEMIDHIVSDLEKNAGTNDFEKEFKNSLKRVDWYGNLRHLNTAGWQNANKKYRKEYHKGFVNFFKHPKNLLVLLISVGFSYCASEYLTFKLFERLNFILVAISVVPFFFITTKQWFKKYGKSVNLDYGIFYFSLSFLMINFPLQLVKNTSEVNQKILLLCIIPIYFIATYSGYQVYKKAILRVEKMRKELLS